MLRLEFCKLGFLKDFRFRGSVAETAVYCFSRNGIRVSTVRKAQVGEFCDDRMTYVLFRYDVSMTWNKLAVVD